MGWSDTSNREKYQDFSPINVLLTLPPRRGLIANDWNAV